MVSSEIDISKYVNPHVSMLIALIKQYYMKYSESKLIQKINEKIDVNKLKELNEQNPNL